MDTTNQQCTGLPSFPFHPCDERAQTGERPHLQHVRDIQWVDDQLVIVAIASTLILIRLPQHSRGDLATINFPPFHKVASLRPNRFGR